MRSAVVAGDVILPSVAVPGYPRELEAIILTAMANDPNARFQTGQEMIEALDAFAVRAKLTGSNTAMGRFMTQLFGQKKEPWVESATNTFSDRTADHARESELIDEDEDNEQKTQVVDDREIVRAHSHPYRSRPHRHRESRTRAPVVVPARSHLRRKPPMRPRGKKIRG